MEKESITICGRKFKKTDLPTYEGVEYSNSFQTKKQIVDWYDKVLSRDDVVKTNFGGNPFEWASFIVLEIDGYVVHIHSPRARNTDNNWYSYKENFGFYTNLVLVKKDN